MAISGAKDIIEKLPLTPLLAAWALYLGYDMYGFYHDADSPLLIKQGEVAAAADEVAKLKDKVKTLNDFVQSLEYKKAELRALAQQLEETKAVLVENQDQSDMKKILLTEAKRSGLQVTSIVPLTSPQGDRKAEEYYTSQRFELKSMGVYFQYVAFLDRIANLQKIIHVQSAVFTSDTPPTSKYVELKSTMNLKAFSYLPTHADEISKASMSGASQNPVSPAGVPAGAPVGAPVGVPAGAPVGAPAGAPAGAPGGAAPAAVPPVQAPRQIPGQAPAAGGSSQPSGGA